MVCRISCATCTSRLRLPPGSGVSETRIVSPMPSCKSTDMAAVEATMPLEPMPASVRPRCAPAQLPPSRAGFFFLQPTLHLRVELLAALRPLAAVAGVEAVLAGGGRRDGSWGGVFVTFEMEPAAGPTYSAYTRMPTTP